MDEANETIEVSVAELQKWALSLSQGDTTPRWKIEKLLEDNNCPTRDPRT